MRVIHYISVVLKVNVCIYLIKLIQFAATLSKSDSDSDSWLPYSNTKEKYLKGLKHGVSRSRKNVTIGLVPDHC